MADTSEQGRRAAGSLVEELVIDPWASLSFKRAMGGRRQPGVSWQSPGWVGEEHARRLMAYKIRDAYARNIARFFLATGDAKKRSNHREYGDASLLIETVKAALLGDKQDIMVPGADEFNEDTKQATSENKQEVDQTEARRASGLQDDLRKWAEKERFKLKLVETERNAIKLADGVYALGWDDKKKRPRLRVYDPGNYFPVYDDGNEDEFPNRVHIAWEIDDAVQEGDKTRVHRITWELREVDPYDLPWNDEPTELECFMSEGVWTIGNEADNIDDFTEQNVEWVQQPDGTERRDVPLGIDYIPVVHLPNTVALIEHFGASVLDSVMQILDDIAATDTDLQQASALAGFPPLAVSKGRLEGREDDATGTTVTTYGPGTAFEVGDGTMTVLDMSNGLTALIEYVNHLLERLEVNARVPAGVLGRIKPSDVPSGIALALSFGPLRTMIDEMRLVRDDKYGLLFRFVTRFMWKNGTLTETEPSEAEASLVFGTFLVVDTTSVVQQVQNLLTAKAISRPTALKMLIEAGIPVEDAAAEIALIQSEDFTGADDLYTATNDQQLVFDYLGIDKKPEDVVPKPSPIDPTPTDPNAPDAPPVEDQPTQ